MERKVKEYFAAADRNREAGLQGPVAVEVLPLLDALYRRASRIESESVSRTFRETSLLSHKALLAASGLIAQRQPEDGEGITRRALEAAKMYLAVKLDSKNLENWISFRERDERWRQRRSGEKPKSLTIRCSKLAGDPLADEISKLIGILSDASVHYTPEYYQSLDWRIDRLEDGGCTRFLNYFQSDQQTVDRAWFLLVGCHLAIVRTIDRCFDNELKADVEANQLFQAATSTTQKLYREYTRTYSSIYLPDWLLSV